MSLKDFLVWQSRRCFFDFENANSRVDGLGIGQERGQSVFTLECMCFLAFLQIFYLFLRRAR